MCIAVLGGMDRLRPHYLEEAEKFGAKLKLFAGTHNDMGAKLRNIDALVIFTNKISHSARKQAVNAVKGQKIPVLQVHSCGVCTLRDCLNCLYSGLPEN
ncbi:MAG: DUF2325 domain-containing protein [Syntrophotaleaceae bacterium]